MRIEEIKQFAGMHVKIRLVGDSTFWHYGYVGDLNLEDGSFLLSSPRYKNARILAIAVDAIFCVPAFYKGEQK